MAGVRKRTSIRARAGASSRRATLDAPTPLVNPAGRPRTKKDKRTAKHDTLLQRIREGGIQKNKTRRPSRKLRAAEDVNELRNALPDVSDDQKDGEDDEWEGLSDIEGDGVTSQVSTARRRRRAQSSSGSGEKMVMNSLQHRPGAMKRKLKMEQSEMQRFSKNLAQLSGSDVNSKDHAAVGGAVGAGDKWAALRRFIGGTMEKDKAFATT